MATASIKYCDACKTTYKVNSYHIEVLNVNPVDGSNGKLVEAHYADLCGKCLKRAKHFIQRGLTPPSKKKSA